MACAYRTHFPKRFISVLLNAESNLGSAAQGWWCNAESQEMSQEKAEPVNSLVPNPNTNPNPPLLQDGKQHTGKSPNEIPLWIQLLPALEGIWKNTGYCSVSVGVLFDFVLGGARYQTQGLNNCSSTHYILNTHTHIHTKKKTLQRNSRASNVLGKQTLNH